MYKNIPGRMLRYLAAALAAALFMPAVLAADDTPAPAAATAQGTPKAVSLGKIKVTGTAIPRTDVETPAPVTIITAEQIKQTGLTTVADVVRTITSDNSGTIPTAFTAGFAAGSSGLALRGLTVNSTLILIDGRRAAAYALADDGERSFTDLNSIPLNAIESIEVLKDGASAIYGADAIAGVVNIKLYEQFKGTQVTAEAGTSQHGGGTTTRVTVLGGTGDLEQDRFNAYYNFEYEKDNAIWDRDRGYPYNTADLTQSGGLDNNAGNPGLLFGSTYGAVAPVSGGGTGAYQPLRPCGVNSIPKSDASGDSWCEQSFPSLYGQIQPEVDRVGLSGRMTVQVSSAAQAYIDASFFQDRVVASGNPSQIQNGIPNNTNAITLPVTLLNGSQNPNDPFAGSGEPAAINYAFGDIPGGFADVNHNMRLVGDLNGSLDSGWNYEDSITLNHTWLNVNNYGFILYPQLITDIQTGAYNFVNPAANSQVVRDALSPTLSKTSTTDMDALDLGANRELIQLQGGPMGLGLGVQWRYEAQDDPDLNPNDQFQGLGIAHTIGHRNIAALYVDLDMPLLDTLEMEVAGREDHYSDFGSAFSPKVGIKWTPSKEFGLRATYSKGFRAPSFSENGSSASEGFITETLPASFVAAHGNDGYVQPYGLGLLSSGNPNIQPERARNYTLGAIFQPSDALSGTLDYYNIVKTGVIAQSSPATALSAYFAGQPIPPGYTVTSDIPDPLHPSLLPRPILVASPYINENELKTSGMDLELKYTTLVGPANWTSELDATKIITWEETLGPGQPFTSMVGNQGPYILSSGAGTPRYRGDWSNSVQVDDLRITGTFYYVSGLYMSVPDVTGPGTENLCFSTATPTSTNLPANCSVPSFTYFDLTGEYKLNDVFTLSAAILNLFDHKAPFDPIDYAGQNYNPTFDEAGAIGRFYTVSLKATF